MNRLINIKYILLKLLQLIIPPKQAVSRMFLLFLSEYFFTCSSRFTLTCDCRQVKSHSHRNKERQKFHRALLMCACVCYQPSTCVPRGSTTVSRSASALLVSSPATATKDSNSTKTRRPAQVSEAHTQKYSFFKSCVPSQLYICVFSGFLSLI